MSYLIDVHGIYANYLWCKHIIIHLAIPVTTFFRYQTQIIHCQSLGLLVAWHSLILSSVLLVLQQFNVQSRQICSLVRIHPLRAKKHFSLNGSNTLKENWKIKLICLSRAAKIECHSILLTYFGSLLLKKVISSLWRYLCIAQQRTATLYRAYEIPCHRIKVRLHDIIGLFTIQSWNIFIYQFKWHGIYSPWFDFMPSIRCGDWMQCLANSMRNWNAKFRYRVN